MVKILRIKMSRNSTSRSLKKGIRDQVKKMITIPTQKDPRDQMSNLIRVAAITKPNLTPISLWMITNVKEAKMINWRKKMYTNSNPWNSRINFSQTIAISWNNLTAAKRTKLPPHSLIQKRNSFSKRKWSKVFSYRNLIYHRTISICMRRIHKHQPPNSSTSFTIVLSMCTCSWCTSIRFMRGFWKLESLLLKKWSRISMMTFHKMSGPLNLRERSRFL